MAGPLLSAGASLMRMVSATRWRFGSASSTLTLTICPASTTSRGSLTDFSDSTEISISLGKVSDNVPAVELLRMSFKVIDRSQRALLDFGTVPGKCPLRDLNMHRSSLGFARRSLINAGIAGASWFSPGSWVWVWAQIAQSLPLRRLPKIALAGLVILAMVGASALAQTPAEPLRATPEQRAASVKMVEQLRVTQSPLLQGAPGLLVGVIDPADAELDHLSNHQRRDRPL